MKLFINISDEQRKKEKEEERKKREEKGIQQENLYLVIDLQLDLLLFLLIRETT